MSKTQVELVQFEQSPSAWQNLHPFGGGWKPGQDPGSKGWRFRYDKRVGGALCGRPRQQGSFIVRTRPGGYIIMLFWGHTPEQLLEGVPEAPEAWPLGENLPPGWALPWMERVSDTSIQL